MKSLTTFLLLFNMLAATSQTVEYSGLIALPDSTFITYKVDIIENDGYISGYSYTDLNGPHESKNSIVGRYDDKSNHLEFREVDLIYTKSPIDELDFCYVYYSGQMRRLNGKSNLEGNFKSYYDDLEPCINGELMLQSAEKAERKLEKLKRKIDKTSRIADSVKQRLNESSFFNVNKRQGLKGGETLNVLWNSKVAYLEIWDPGTVDGDAMSISLNGKTLEKSYAPKKSKRKIPLILDKDQSKLTLIALTEGTEPPNTAQIRLTDGNGKEISMLSSFKVGEKVEVVFYFKDLK
ncbi:hypothetical protein [Nonlabens ponticola]|uniref:DUF4369 domain-containing protein n=1 Tax=Nonlabens ponticola TaxID=2496866 RepID=A0A3S9MXB7_9FLAO|nr:hypothetical protein [Nonlabens ponticola]AZQ43787.1 hypothetical protein EJ995_05920 [Nonlabens ponticola]